MAFNDFLKKAKETATNAADVAKTKFNEQREKAVPREKSVSVSERKSKLKLIMQPCRCLMQ